MSTQASISSVPVARRKGPPVTAHPWFPAIVALWFAALLGLSSLVLGAAMLERLVAASRIDTIVAAAAPPLGQTARLLVALALAGLGGMFGLVLGRVIGGRSRGAARRSGVVPAPGEGELAAAGFDAGADSRLGLRDRLAQLTGQGDGPRDFEDLPKLRGRDRHPDAPGRKPLTPSEDLSDDAEVSGANLTWRAPFQDIPPTSGDADVTTAKDAFAPPPFAPPMARASDTWLAPGPFAEPAAAAIDPADDASEAVQPEPAVAQGDEPVETGAIASDEMPLLHCAPASPPLPIEQVALDSLGVVQMTERLALAMQARRGRDALRAQARAQASTSEESPMPPPTIATLRPSPAPESVPPAPESGAAPDSKALEAGYSSLLGLSRKPSSGAPSSPAQASPAASSTPSVATPFASNIAGGMKSDGPPSTAMPEASDPAESYRALKSALDSLQRISGTG